MLINHGHGNFWTTPTWTIDAKISVPLKNNDQLAITLIIKCRPEVVLHDLSADVMEYQLDRDR
jgi:hypothetical protein